jgi:hypothetical protein
MKIILVVKNIASNAILIDLSGKKIFVDLAQKSLWGRFLYHGQMCPFYSVKKIQFFFEHLNDEI